MVGCHVIFGLEAEKFPLKQGFNSLEFYCAISATENKDLLPAANGVETLKTWKIKEGIYLMCLNNKSRELHSCLRSEKESLQDLVLNGEGDFLNSMCQWSSSETPLLFVISFYY